MTKLTEAERRNLERLAAWGNQAAELSTARQVEFWRKMEARGYARLADNARCGFERVRGDFVSITPAGRALLEQEGTK